MEKPYHEIVFIKVSIKSFKKYMKIITNETEALIKSAINLAKSIQKHRIQSETNQRRTSNIGNRNNCAQQL